MNNISISPAKSPCLWFIFRTQDSDMQTRELIKVIRNEVEKNRARCEKSWEKDRRHGNVRRIMGKSSSYMEIYGDRMA